MEAEFLAACVAGDFETAAKLKAEHHSVSIAVDEQGRNGAHIAVLNGHWQTAYYLIRDLKVSPYKVTLARDTLYHTIVRQSAVQPPTQADFREIYQQQEATWRAEEEKLVAKQQGEPIPQGLVVPYQLKLAEYFDNPLFTLLLLLLNKFHLSLKEVNSQGLTPSDLSASLNLPQLAAFFDHHSLPTEQRKRLVAGLTPNLFRQVVLLL